MGLEYEQLPRESAKAYAAFRTYLDLGPERSLAATGAKLGKSKVLMERWSRKFDWVGRVEVHASHLARTLVLSSTYAPRQDPHLEQNRVRS